MVRNSEHDDRCVAVTVLIALLFLLGSAVGACSSALRSEESSTLAHASAEDHLAAALLYLERAQQLELEALKYEQEAEHIEPLEDTKGFRREALRITAAAHRRDAQTLRNLADREQGLATTTSQDRSPAVSPPPP